jgi:Rieske Fe-S protein
MSRSPHLNRKEFVVIATAFLGSIMAVAVGLPGIGFLISPALNKKTSDAWVSAGPLENYPIGDPTLFTFTRTTINGWEKTVNSYGAYIYRKDESSIKAFRNVCTHLSCRVTWEEPDQVYFCPCHDGLFDINGVVVAGPPPKPLEQFETKVEEDVLYLRVLEG